MALLQPRGYSSINYIYITENTSFFLSRFMPRKKDLAESVMLTVIRKKSSLEGKVLEYIKESEQGGRTWHS